MKGFFCSLLILALVAGAALADTRIEAGGYALTFDEQAFEYRQNMLFGMDMLLLDAMDAGAWPAACIFILRCPEGAGPDELQDLQETLQDFFKTTPSDEVLSGFHLVPEAEPQFLLHYVYRDEAQFPGIMAVVDSFEIVPDGPLVLYVPVDGALERKEVVGRLTPAALSDALNAAGAFPEPVTADSVTIGRQGAYVYLDEAFQRVLDQADTDEALYRKCIEDTFHENYRVENVYLFFRSRTSEFF